TAPSEDAEESEGHHDHPCTRTGRLLLNSDLAEAASTDAFEFGALLRRYRLAAGLSQGALAERARLSPCAISALERGTRRAPYQGTVRALAAALGLASSERSALG